MASLTARSPGTMRHRELYKATTPPWKETRCFTKFQKARERLVDAFRQLPSAEEMNRKCACLMDQVMDREWRELYEQMPEFSQLDQREIDQLEEEIRQEMKDHEETQMEKYYLSLVELQTEEIHEIAESYDKVLCPICKKNFLREFNSAISCSCGAWMFSNSGVLSLDRFNEDLNNSLENHYRYCDNAPTFSTETDAPMRKSYLRIFCQACKFQCSLP